MPVPDTKYVLNLAQQIEDAKSRLRDLEEKWASLFTPVNDLSHDTLTATLSDRILDLLTSHADEDFSSVRVADILAANQNSVGSLLSRLVSQDKIEKRGHGAYGAKKTKSPDPLEWRSELNTGAA